MDAPHQSHPGTNTNSTLPQPTPGLSVPGANPERHALGSGSQNFSATHPRVDAQTPALSSSTHDTSSSTTLTAVPSTVVTSPTQIISPRASSVPGGGLIAAAVANSGSILQTPRSSSILSHHTPATPTPAPTGSLIDRDRDLPAQPQAQTQGQSPGHQPPSTSPSVQFLPTTNLGTNTQYGNNPGRSRSPSQGHGGVGGVHTGGGSDGSNNTLVSGQGGGGGDIHRPTRRGSRGGVSIHSMRDRDDPLPALPPSPPLEAVLADGGSPAGRMPPTRMRSLDATHGYAGGSMHARRSGLDWIVPSLEEKAPNRERTVGERLGPTIKNAKTERDKYIVKARMTGYALNIAIGLQVLLGALTTGLSAVTTGRTTSVVTAILGGFSTIVASYLARARGSNEPELSITRVKDLEQFIRESEAFDLDHGHETGDVHDATLNGFRNRFEELLGNANG
ncbi:hypothetical protein AX16_009488 [Volvariella volvacea WC 439]|nr:hypothetical protein AX16_009488 [Volvariella volvacea WC 439]